MSGGLPWEGDYQKTGEIGQLNLMTKKWTIVGKLQTARQDHSAIFYDNHFLVVGGNAGDDNALPTEKCTFVNDQVTCKSQTPNLTRDFYSNIEIFIVPFDFCQ